MLIAIALMAQGVTLDADQTKAAMACAAASSTVNDATPHSPSAHLEGIAHTTWFTMTAARPGPVDKSFLDRVTARVDELTQAPVPALADAKALMPLCDARFPLARRAGPTRLPAGELDRNLMCAGAGAFLAGAAPDRDGTTQPSLQWVVPFRDRFLGLVGTQRGAGGVLADQSVFQDRFSAQLMLSLDYGNFYGVAAACRALK